VAVPQSVWVLTDGKVGMENQCLGLARALGFAPVIKRVAIRLPWRLLPPQLWVDALAATTERLAPPWPDLLIATGRQTVALSIAIRQAAGGRCFTVQLQDPDVSPAKFDLVVAPEHDGLAGANVIATRGAMHGVSKEALAAAADKFRARLASLKRPLVAVLLGGSNGRHRMDRESMARLGALLRRVAEERGAGLAITPSRRTGADNLAALRDALAGTPCEIWDETGDNPYLGYLALADAIVATSDSVNMVSEACATGKPVHVFHLPGGSAKFRRFHATFEAAGYTRPFDGRLESWAYDPLRETERVAASIRARLKDRSQAN
jgi:mitochondrial fission protein ELM1